MSTSVPPDPAVLLQAAANDPAALARLVAHYQPELVDWLTRVLRDRELAEEATQETWLVLSRGAWSFSPRTGDPAGDVRAWLRQVAMRAAFRQRARQHRQGVALARWLRERQAQPPETTPLEYLSEGDRHAVVWAAIGSLPPRLREALELRFRDGLDFATIGRVQRCTALTARVRIWRALGRLRRRLLLVGLLFASSWQSATLRVAEAGAVAYGRQPGWRVTIPGAAMRTLTGLASSGALVSLVLTNSLQGWPGEAVAGGAVPGTQAAMRVADLPSGPWTLRRALVAGEDDRCLCTGPGDGERSQVQLEVRSFRGNGLTLPYPSDRASLLAPCEAMTVRALVQNAQDGRYPGASAGTSDPEAMQADDPTGVFRLRLGDGRRGRMIFGGFRDYVAGYLIQDACLAAIHDRVIGGLHCRVTVRIEPGGIRIIDPSVVCRSPPRAESQTAHIVNGVDVVGTVMWEEITMRESRGVILPEEGVQVPAGASLLLPCTTGVVWRITPEAVNKRVDPAADPWWVLITPTSPPPMPPGQEQDLEPDLESEPPVPSARG